MPVGQFFHHRTMVFLILNSFFGTIGGFNIFFFREIPQSRKINQNIHKARSESKYLLRFVVNLLLFKAKNWFGRLTMRILKIFQVVQIGGSSKGVLATGIIFPSGHFLR